MGCGKPPGLGGEIKSMGVLGEGTGKGLIMCLGCWKRTEKEGYDWLNTEKVEGSGQDREAIVAENIRIYCQSKCSC
jgi:hypothetical protein